MATNPNDAFTKPAASNPALNALKTGLYSAHDFIRKGEEAEYYETRLGLMKDLSPQGTLEETFATEIIGATWRLRRCRMVEEDLAEITVLDPMVDEQTAKQQKSVDRARAQSLSIMRRCIAELRQLQTTRQLRTELKFGANIPVLTDIQKAARSMQSVNALDRPAKMSKEETLNEFERLMGISDVQLNQLAIDPAIYAKPAAAAAPVTVSFCEPAAAPVTPFCKPAPNTPRNAPCPCRSAKKFKKCCGNPAASGSNNGLNKAA